MTLNMACDAPLSIKYDPPLSDGKGGWIYYFPADCGKCMKCLIKRKAQWSFRMVEEMRVSFSSYFVTLTYDDYHLPIGDSGPVGNKNDHHHFIKWLKYYENEKRLSQRISISPSELARKKNRVKETGRIKYYGVLEYGDENSRPHLHYILFNVRDTDSIGSAWAEQKRVARGVYRPGSGYGRIQIDECNINTIDYVLKYMMKDQSDKHEQKEVSWMSKGLGESVATPEMVKYMNEPRGNLVVNQRGSKVALPRYYRKKFVSEDSAKAKALYIRDQVEKDEAKKDARMVADGANPDKLKAEAKDTRNHLLKNRKQRNLK